jgi:hypothetical protein
MPTVNEELDIGESSTPYQTPRGKWKVECSVLGFERSED